MHKKWVKYVAIILAVVLIGTTLGSVGLSLFWN
ncbi:transcriptional regulator [Ruminiclostridium sufflavum]|nr:transcriptional regulator [Ruminiclostridium sufflavum]